MPLDQDQARGDPRDSAGIRLPHNDEAEMALLGAILHANRAYEKVATFLKPEHFASRVHGRIYSVCAGMIDAGKTADPITLKSLFDADGDLTDIGGFSYLMRLAGSVVTIVNAEDYGRTIHDLYLRRDLIALGREMIERAADDNDPADPPTIAREIEERLYTNVSPIEQERGPVTLDTAVDAALLRLQEAFQSDGKMVGAPTGLTDLDQVLHGLLPGDLVTVAGATGMGKTGFITNIVLAAAEAGHGALCFTLEMPGDQMAARALSQISNIATDRWRSGQISRDDWDRAEQARARLRGLPVRFIDRGRVTATDIRSQARRMARGQPLGIVVVDHIGLVRQQGGFRDRYQHLTELTGDMKALALDLNVCVIMVSQLSRTVAGRDATRPQLSDLRDSGSIEQDSDRVLFVYRPEYYLKHQEPRDRKLGENSDKFIDRQTDWQNAMRAARGIGEVIVAKNRHGAEATIRCAFTDYCVRWGNLAQQEGFV